MQNNKEYTFTAKQLIQWAKEHSEYADFFMKDKTGSEAYKIAMNHLIIYAENPIKDII